MDANKQKVVFGIYGNRNDVESTVSALQHAGFRHSDISVLMADKEATQEFAHEKHTKVPEGATTGAGTGAVVGGTLGWLMGIGTLAIPGVGPFIAAGPIMAALAGVGIGSVLGGITGALVGIGIPEYEAKRYSEMVKNGGMLLSVHSDNPEWTQKAQDILKQHGATDVSSTSEEPRDTSKKAAGF